MINVGINGFGRIGRVLSRIIQQRDNINVVAINDINPDIENINYLFNYDTTYGALKEKTLVKDGFIVNSATNIKVFQQEDINEVPWDKSLVDIIIDSSGISENLKHYEKLRDKVNKIVVTNSPDPDLVDREVIYGVNHKSIDRENDFIISSSICDATAIAPVIRLINKEFEIQNGFLTTLHPWLGYQNLLDGPSKSYAVPGEIIDNYALGRASPMALIPKNTSAISATSKILPEIKNKFASFSYRIPTNIVSSADLTLLVSKDIKKEDVKDLFINYEKENPKIISNNYEALVSSDFIGSEISSNIDHRFLIVKDKFIKLMCWYDNEWGYSSRVCDLIDFLKNKN